MDFRYEVLAFYFTYLTLFSLRFFRPLSVWVEDGFSLCSTCFLFYLLNPIQLTLFSTSFVLGGGWFFVMQYLLSILLTYHYSVYAFFDLCLSGWRMVFSYEVLAFYFTYLTLFSLRFFPPLSVWVKGGFSLWGNCYLFYILNPIQLTLLSTSVFLGGGWFSVMRYLLSILLT